MSEQQEDLEARIAAYIDGELPEAEAARLEVFLANTDPQMAERVIGMLSDKHKVMGLPREAAPPDLATHVMEQLERVSLLHDVENLHVPRRSWWQSRLTTMAAALLLLGGFGWLVMHTLVQPGSHDEWSKRQLSKTEKPAPAIEMPAAKEAESKETAATPTLEARRSDSDSVRSVPAGPGGSGGAGALPAPTLAPAPSVPTAPARSMVMKGGRDSDAIDRGSSMGKLGAADKPVSDVKDVSAHLDVKSEETVQRQLANGELIAQNGTEEARRLKYDSADSAAKALATLSVHGSLATRDPVVVTLVARDDQDPQNLRTTLQGFMADSTTSRQQQTLQKRYNAIARNTDNTLNLNSSGSFTGGNTLGGTSGNTIGNAGATVNNAAATQSASNVSNNEQFMVYNRRTFEPLDGYTTLNSAAGNNAVFQQQRLANNDLMSPYRVVLREDQLQKITSEFQVYALTCGSRQFVITPEVTVADAGNKKQTDALRKTGMEKASGLPGAMPAGSAARPEGAAMEKEKIEQQKLDEAKQPQFAAQAQEAVNQRWIDCVIKMEPRAQAQYHFKQSAPNSAASQQNQSPAK